jgi:DNA-binding Xre family transcriptional regulator
VRWNLRLAAAQRGIWKASEMQRLLAEHGLVISAGKMSGLWSAQPASIKLDELDVFCAVLGCNVQELLLAEPEKVTRVSDHDEQDTPQQAAAGGAVPPSPVRPRPRTGRSLPPR